MQTEPFFVGWRGLRGASARAAIPARCFPLPRGWRRVTSVGSTNRFFRAMFKAVVKIIALLVILFVMLYVGMNNTHAIDFHFPIAGTTTKTPIHAPAALVYFGMFAVGVLAGTILTVGDNSKKKSSPSKDR
jgi:uncharacterized integral membrane protein